MEWGPEDSYMTKREQLRWVRYGDRAQWEPYAETATSFDETEAAKFYKHCTEDGSGQSSAIDRIDSGVIIQGGEFNLDARTASVNFIRPFDISSDHTLTLVGGTTYKAWLTWGIFGSDDDRRASLVRGQRNEGDGVSWAI